MSSPTSDVTLAISPSSGLAPPVIPGLVEFWNQNQQVQAYPRLEKGQELQTDVVIIGAGVAGLATALNLLRAKPSLGVVVVEGRCRGAGQSGRSTGELSTWNDDYYSRLVKEHGAHVASLVAASHADAIQWVEHTVAEEWIQCNFERLDGYLVDSETAPHFGAAAAATTAASGAPTAAPQKEQQQTAQQASSARDEAQSGVSSARQQVEEAAGRQAYHPEPASSPTTTGEAAAPSAMVKRTPAMLERSPRMDPFDEPVQSEQQAEEQPLAGSSTLPPALLRRSGQIETLGRDGKPQVAGQTDIEGAAAAAGAVDEESAAGAALVAGSAPLAAELAACCALGMSSVSSVQLPASAPAFGGGRRALRFPGCAQLHPVRLISGLAAAVVAAGGQIYEGCKVCSTINKVVRLSTGAKVHARQAIVFASFTPLNQNLAIHSRQRPYRRYSLALQLPSGSTPRALYYDTDRYRSPSGAYHSARIVPAEASGLGSDAQQQQQHDVLLVSGGQHPSGAKAEEYAGAYQDLEAWARARWPQAGPALAAWAHQSYETVDCGLPLIGADPLNPLQGCYYLATGDSGQPLISAVIAGMLLSDLILNRHNPYKVVYDTARAWPLHDRREVRTELGYLGTVAARLAERLLPRSLADVRGLLGAQDIEDLQPGQGCICQQGIHKVAVYVDEQGQRHKHSAVCTHMGCLVRWNPLDRTFECPCHGSCYDGFGNNICGPSRADLKPAKGLWLV